VATSLEGIKSTVSHYNINNISISLEGWLEAPEVIIILTLFFKPL